VLAASVDHEVAFLATLGWIRDGQFDPGILGGPSCPHLIDDQPHRLRLGVRADPWLENLLGPLVDGLRSFGVSSSQAIGKVSNEGAQETALRGHATNL